MIFFSIGLPSRLAAWCDALITELAGGGDGGAEAVAANTLDEVAAAAIRARAAHLVVCSRQPVPRLQAELVQSEQPFVIALGDPRTVLYDLLASGGSDLVSTTRLVASSCAAMRTLREAANALVVSDAAASDPVAMAQAVCDHLGVVAGTTEISRLLARLAASGLSAGEEAAAAAEVGLDGRGEAVVNGALLPYLEAATPDGEVEPLIWERELFYLHEDPSAPAPVAATRPVDLTGRARVLIYGPYVSLPPGRWSANVVLALSAETAGMSFMLDICAGRRLSHTRVESTGAQVIEVTLRFAVDASVDQPIEVRVLSERAAFEGQLAIGQVTLTPEKAMDPEVRDYLTQMLRA